MLYLHSATPLENHIYRRMTFSSISVTEYDLRYMDDEKLFVQHLRMYPTKTILYTFFDLDQIDYLPSVQKKKNQIEWILRCAAENGVENIIYVTYPGAFHDSANIYLQQEGVIQQRIASSSLHYTFLGIHALCDFEHQWHSLHHLYFLDKTKTYDIPLSTRWVYALYLDDFISIILKLRKGCTNKSYEVFSVVYTLKEFLEWFGGDYAIRKWPNGLFQGYSFLISKKAPCKVDMAWRPLHKLHRKKIEKDLGINLFAKIHQGYAKPRSMVYKSLPVQFHTGRKDVSEALFI